VHAWLKDAVGNISALSNGGTGTTGKDKAVTSYTPGDPPSLSNILATGAEAPANPPSNADLTAASGATVYIKWRATDDTAFPGNAISLYYTTDNVTYNTIATGLANGVNGGCTLNHAGTTLDDNVTGCHAWTSATSSPFKIRVSATDAAGFTTLSTSSWLNISTINFIAGNTDLGLGGSASSAVLLFESVTSVVTDPNSLAVKSDGTIFYRDRTRGILKLDPATGVISSYIPQTGTATGDGGQATDATLRQARRITLDFSAGERLLIWDHDRIRRVEANGVINTIIGGGASTADNVDPLSVSISPMPSMNDHMGKAFFAMPNGNIYFHSDGGASGAVGLRVRYLDAASNTVKSFSVTGTGDGLSAATNVASCSMTQPALAFDRLTGSTTYGLIQSRHIASTNPAGCNDVDNNYSITRFDPATGVSYGPGQQPTHQGQAVAHRIVGRDGKIYTVSRNNGSTLYRYNETTRGMDVVAGSLGNGYCVDGTHYTACKTDLQDAFVKADGTVYLVDHGTIRVIDSSGNLQTIAGQRLFAGDGGPAPSARFGDITDIRKWVDGGTGKYVVFDHGEARIREFSIGGNVTHLAGEGSIVGSMDTSTAATAQGMLTVYASQAAN
jgi:hypothetical protein